MNAHPAAIPILQANRLLDWCSAKRGDTMTVLKGFVIVLLSGIAFALGGAGIGYGLGTIMPDFYRATSPLGREPWFNPVHFGLGQGLTQGLVCGLAVGSVIVLAVSWHSARRRGPDVQLRASRLTTRADEAAGSQGITLQPR
jgi:hypothetical protein